MGPDRSTVMGLSVSSLYILTLTPDRSTVMGLSISSLYILTLTPDRSTVMALSKETRERGKQHVSKRSRSYRGITTCVSDASLLLFNSFLYLISTKTLPFPSSGAMANTVSRSLDLVCVPQQTLVYTKERFCHTPGKLGSLGWRSRVRGSRKSFLRDWRKIEFSRTSYQCEQNLTCMQPPLNHFPERLKRFHHGWQSWVNQRNETCQVSVCLRVCWPARP